MPNSQFLLPFLLLFVNSILYAQPTPPFCLTPSLEELAIEQPEVYAEIEIFNRYAQQYVLQKNTTSYTIPVVFHVYGTTQGGKTITLEKLETVLEKLTEDFQGLNPDYGSVATTFQPIRQTLNIEFKLAQKAEDGTATTGMIVYPEKGGYASNDTDTDTQVAADAWDNYKYVNIYLQNDLYGDGATNNSGVATYPNTNEADMGLSRIVYNGAVIYGNTNNEFASVMTHEMGHFLNLLHTFEGGCPNGDDMVSDTPLENHSNAHECSGSTNCNGNEVNVENYMGYTGAAGCYKMFTQGQVNRMTAALNDNVRSPLWQPSNLLATGVMSSLPVELVRFNAQAKDQKIVLNWTTASEENSRFFVLERSVDNDFFIDITSIPAKNIANSYEFIDTDISPNTTYYYRLRQEDNDRSWNYSKIITAEYKTNSSVEVRIFPNPIGGNKNLQVSGRSIHTVHIYSLTKNLLYEDFFSTPQNSLIINLKSLPAGVYLVSLNKDTPQKLVIY